MLHTQTQKCHHVMPCAWHGEYLWRQKANSKLENTSWAASQWPAQRRMPTLYHSLSTLWRSDTTMSLKVVQWSSLSSSLFVQNITSADTMRSKWQIWTGQQGDRSHLLLPLTGPLGQRDDDIDVTVQLTLFALSGLETNGRILINRSRVTFLTVIDVGNLCAGNPHAVDMLPYAAKHTYSDF